MRFVFHKEAEAEFEAAVAFYDAKAFRLGLAFSEEIYDSIQRILQFPTAWPVFHHPRIRRHVTNRFPYRILYSIDGDTIRIVAIMHVRKDPTYWISRIE